MVSIDYDPEDTTDAFHDRDLDQEDTVDDEKAREHYVEVGKSSLRNKQFLLDDPRYAGKRTSRKDLFSDDEWVEEENDGDSVASDTVQNKDDDSEEDAESWNGFSDEQQDEEQQDDDDDDQEQSGSEDEDEDEEEEDDDDEEDEDEQKQSEVQDQLRRIQQEEQ